MYSVACFGDSLIYGFPYGPASSWLKQVETLNSKIKLYNYGECGACCDDVFCNLKRTILPEYVRNVIFLGGANDLLQARPIPEIVKDIEFAFQYVKCSDRNFAVILPWFSSDSVFNKRIDLLRDSIIDTMTGRCAVFDFQEVLNSSNERDKLFIDGIHPLSKTYEMIGTYAEPILYAWLKK